MASKNANYEVQLLKDGRWSTQSYLDDEATAVAAARRYLMDKTCQGAKVIRNWSRHDGKMTETEVFSEQRGAQAEGPVRIVPIETASDRCVQADDYFRPASRDVVNRLLRNYFEKIYITPTELLHNFKELKRLQDKDTLLPSAVDRVAGLQTRDGAMDAKARREEIYKSIDALSARAKRAEALKLPKMADSVRDLMAQMSAFAADEDPTYLAQVVLSNALLDLRNWLGKLEKLCQWAVGEFDPVALDLLDGVMSDVLGANVIQEVLGWQPSLASAIVAMLDLADGGFDETVKGVGESTLLLNQLFHAQKLPLSRQCLIDRALRQLASANPLSRNDSSREQEAFGQVVQRVVGSGGMAYGPACAEALTQRYGRSVEQGGVAGRRAAVIGTFNAMPDRCCGMMYLCALFGSSYVPDHLEEVFDRAQTLFHCRTLSHLCHASLGVKDRMIRVTNTHRQIESSDFPADFKQAAMDHLDGILERYLVSEQVIEKLDHHESPLRDRAIRLVHFCAAGVLPEGRAMSRARERILLLLRQQHFDAHFVDGVDDPAKAQKMLRDFHQLLVRAGFGK